MLLVVGTVPTPGLPLTFGEARLDGDTVWVGDQGLPCMQGTGAMISTATLAARHVEAERPFALVAGDIGKGDGSRLLYGHVAENLSEFGVDVVALHYLLPMITPMKRVVGAWEQCDPAPRLIADAGAMYAAKAAGVASSFELFTPDLGEIGFLADPEASHPAYIQRYLVASPDLDVPQLVAQAYEQSDAAKVLLVKGRVDNVAEEGEVVATISEPNVPEMEPIGGTGDTVTGLIAGFMAGGMEPVRAATLAARCNRLAGHIAPTNPATKIAEIMSRFPAVFQQVEDWGNDSGSE